MDRRKLSWVPCPLVVMCAQCEPVGLGGDREGSLAPPLLFSIIDLSAYFSPTSPLLCISPALCFCCVFILPLPCVVVLRVLYACSPGWPGGAGPGPGGPGAWGCRPLGGGGGAEGSGRCYLGSRHPTHRGWVPVSAPCCWGCDPHVVGMSVSWGGAAPGWGADQGMTCLCDGMWKQGVQGGRTPPCYEVVYIFTCTFFKWAERWQ